VEETEMKSVAISMTITAFAASLASPARAGSLGDCYDLAVLECGLVWGDQDYGDDDYKKCINDQFDICDATHKSGGGSKLKLKTAKPPRSLKFRLETR
jgi:hypothetical protein